LSESNLYAEVEIYRKNAKTDLDGGLGLVMAVPFDAFVTVSAVTNITNATITVPLLDKLHFAVGDTITFYDNSSDVRAFSSETLDITAISGTVLTLAGEWTTPPVADDEICRVLEYSDHVVLGPPPQIHRRALQLSVYYAKLGILGGPVPVHDDAADEYRDALAWIEQVKKGRETIDDNTVPSYAYCTHEDYHPVTNIGDEAGWKADSDQLDDIEEEWDD
jgi:hypothetical protein